MNKLVNKYFSFPDLVEDIVNVVPDDDPLLVSSKEATNFADIVNPIDEVSGMRRNDIDVALSCKDPTLRNTLLGGLAKDVDPLATDNSGLTDDEIASQSIPRNAHISDIIDAGNQVNEYVNSIDDSVPAPASEPAPAPAPATEPSPAPTPQTTV